MFIYEYSKPIDLDRTVIEYSFSTEQMELVQSRIPFAKEDTEFAPEPSVGCSLRTEDGREYGILLLLVSKRLLVFSEKDCDANSAANTFRSYFSDLAPMEFQRLSASYGM